MRRILHRREVAADLTNVTVFGEEGPGRLMVERLGVSDRIVEPVHGRRRIALTVTDSHEDMTTAEVDEDELLVALGLTLWEEQLDREDDQAVTS